jgi:hypothetical protein
MPAWVRHLHASSFTEAAAILTGYVWLPFLGFRLGFPIWPSMLRIWDGFAATMADGSGPRRQRYWQVTWRRRTVA